MKKEEKSERPMHIGLVKCVEKFGSISKLAKALDFDNSQVAKWVYLKRKIPPTHVMKIVKLCGCVRARELRPDVFGRMHLKGIKKSDRDNVHI